MREWRRVLLSRRMVLIFLLEIFLGSAFFMYDCRSAKDITAEGEMLQAYIESYPEFLSSVRENAKVMGTLASLSEGFSAKNIKKTTEDYQRLEGIRPQYGENRGVVLYSEYQTGDILIVAAVFFAVLMFQEERSKGLEGLVRSTKNGRTRLSAERVAIVFCVAGIASTLISLCCILTATLTCGDMELLRPIQSVPEFMRCTLPISIGTYFVMSTVLKALVATLIGLILYLLSALLEPLFAIGICGASLVIEYGLYEWILATDRSAGLKYCNVMALLRTEDFFKSYRNLDVFGEVISFLTVAIVWVLIGLFLWAVGCILLASRKETTRIGGRIRDRIRSFISRLGFPVPMLVWEAKKIFQNQKGLLIFLGVIFLASSSARQYEYKLPSIAINEDILYQRYGGVITEQKVTQMQEDEEEMRLLREELQEELQYEIDRNGPNIVIESLSERIEEINASLPILQRLLEQAKEGVTYAQATGIEVSLIPTETYELLLRDDAATTEKNALFIALAVIGIFAGIGAYENAGNMRPTLRSTKKGRGRLTLAKTVIVVGTCLLLIVLVYRVQMEQIGERGFDNLDATAQSIPLLRGVTTEMSIRTYLYLMFAVRLAAACFVGGIVMLVSRFCRSSMLVVCICIAILVVPMLLASSGVWQLPAPARFIGYCY